VCVCVCHRLTSKRVHGRGLREKTRDTDATDRCARAARTPTPPPPKKICIKKRRKLHPKKKTRKSNVFYIIEATTTLISV